MTCIVVYILVRTFFLDLVALINLPVEKKQEKKVYMKRSELRLHYNVHIMYFSIAITVVFISQGGGHNTN